MILFPFQSKGVPISPPTSACFNLFQPPTTYHINPDTHTRISTLSKPHPDEWREATGFVRVAFNWRLWSPCGHIAFTRRLQNLIWVEGGLFSLTFFPLLFLLFFFSFLSLFSFFYLLVYFLHDFWFFSFPGFAALMVEEVKMARWVGGNKNVKDKKSSWTSPRFIFSFSQKPVIDL